MIKNEAGSCSPWKRLFSRRWDLKKHIIAESQLCHLGSTGDNTVRVHLYITGVLDISCTLLYSVYCVFSTVIFIFVLLSLGVQLVRYQASLQAFKTLITPAVVPKRHTLFEMIFWNYCAELNMCWTVLNVDYFKGWWVWLSFKFLTLISNFYKDGIHQAPTSVHHCLYHIWCTHRPGWLGAVSLK